MLAMPACREGDEAATADGGIGTPPRLTSCPTCMPARTLGWGCCFLALFGAAAMVVLA